MATARIATWNLERKKPTTPTGAAGIAHLASLEADVLVLTEGRTTYPAGEGHVVWSRPLGRGPEERLVVMWSRHPWSKVDDLGHPSLPPGRFVAATTETPIGPVDVLGVCITWHMADVQYGARNRKPWEVHITYLEVLVDVLAEWPTDRPIVVAGDFNQRLTDPMKRDGRSTEPMFRCFEQMDMPTIGVVPDWPREENDHIATRGLRTVGVRAWPNVVDGVRCSDHGGVLIDVTT